MYKMLMKEIEERSKWKYISSSRIGGFNLGYINLMQFLSNSQQGFCTHR